jgi:hypothetical protein
LKDRETREAIGILRQAERELKPYARYPEVKRDLQAIQREIRELLGPMTAEGRIYERCA